MHTYLQTDNIFKPPSYSCNFTEVIHETCMSRSLPLEQQTLIQRQHSWYQHLLASSKTIAASMCCQVLLVIRLATQVIQV